MTKIGVTGHQFLDNSKSLIQSVDQALEIISGQFEPPYTMISPLAEGSDRLIVYRAFAHWEGAHLVVVLPMDVDDYLADFKTLSSRADFINLMQVADEILSIPKATSREAAYEAAGARVVEMCDVLIALWDGQKARGKGGAGDMVAYARKKCLPLVWIHTANQIHGMEPPVSLVEEQGIITLENFRPA